MNALRIPYLQPPGVEPPEPLETMRDLQRLRQFRLGLFDEEEDEEPNYDWLSRLREMEPIAKGNITRQRRLEAAGIPTQETLQPTEPMEKPNFLQRILSLPEKIDEPIRRYGVGGLLESLGAVNRGTLTGQENVTGSEIVQALRGKIQSPKEEANSDFWDTVGGFALEVAASPLTYITGGIGAGAKLLKGGKAVATLNKMGTKALGAKAGYIAEQMAKKQGVTAQEVLPKAYDYARKQFTKQAEKGILPEAMIDKGGLKFMGKMVIPGGQIRDAFEAFRNAPLIKEVGDALAPTLTRISNVFRAPIYNFQHASILRRFHGLVNEEADSGVRLAVGTATEYGFKSKLDREALTTGMERLKSVSLPKGMKVPEIPDNVDAFWNHADVRKAFKQELDNIPEFKGRTDKAIDAMREFNKMFTTTRKAMNDAGVDVNGFVEYFVPHIYQFRGVGKRAAQIPAQALSKMDLPGRGKPRLIETIDKAREILQKIGIEADIKLDMAELYAAYHRSAYMAIAKKRMMGELRGAGLVNIQKGIPTSALVAQNIRQAGKADIIGKEAAEEVAGYITDLPPNQFGFMARKGAQPFEYVRRNIKEGIDEIRWNGELITGPSQVLRSLENLADVNVAPDEIRMLGRFFGSIQRGFKKYVTTPWPAFHVRNLYSDMQRAVYDVGIAAVDPRLQGKTIATMLNKGGTLDTPMGKISLEQIRDWFMEYGGMSYDIGRRDITKTIAERMSLATTSAKLNPVVQWMRGMEKGGVYVENHTKMMLFIRNLERGMAPDEALNRALKFVFDYNSASAADKYFRTAIPFWTFMKKNLAFQARRFVEAPGQQLATIRALGAMEKAIPQAMGVEPLSPEEQQALPDFIKENVAIPFWRKANGEALLFTNIDLSIQQLNELFSLPNGFTWESLRRTAQKNAASISPLIKNLAEIAFRWDAFFGTPLAGEYLDPTTGRRLTPFERRKDLPEIFSLLPGITSETTEKGTDTRINPYWGKFYDIFGAGRILSEAPKAVRFGRALKSGERVPAVGNLLDIFSGVKVRPENLRERQLQDILGRIAGRSNLLDMQRRRERIY